jgi:hypothetical protein
VLQSSSELGWSNLFAEVRSYGRGKGAHPEHFSNKAERLGLVGIDVPVAGRAAENLIHPGAPN